VRITASAQRKDPPLILVASDREPSAEEIERVLWRQGYTVLRAHTARTARAAAKSATPHVILIDAFLPEEDSFALCRELRDDPDVGPSRPMLMITGSRPSLVEHRSAVRSGVWEFMVEPLHPGELAGRVDACVLSAMEARQRARVPLMDDTGLYTAEGLALRARQLARQAFHHHAGLACVVLRAARPEDAPRIARGLKAAGRHSDAIGQIGPAEFAIIAPGTDGHGACRLAERLAREIRAGDDAAPELRAGYDAVPNVRFTPLAPRHLLERARMAASEPQA
jgi:PleD family two-component response regulator